MFLVCLDCRLLEADGLLLSAWIKKTLSCNLVVVASALQNHYPCGDSYVVHEPASVHGHDRWPRSFILGQCSGQAPITENLLALDHRMRASGQRVLWRLITLVTCHPRPPLENGGGT